MAQRTRSQLTLPDDMLLRLPQRSPMKGACSARRTLPQEQPMSPNHTNEPRPKRSMSPAPEIGTLTRHSEPPPERQTKRAKKALDVPEGSDHAPRKKDGAGNRRLHSRNALDPNVSRMRRSTRKRSATSTESNKPASYMGVAPSTKLDLPPVNGRAQSVPLFPTTYSLPFIDLKNPPPSPHRARSRSPEKEEPKLRVAFEPTKLDVAVDETEERMEVEEAPHRDAAQILDMHVTDTTNSSNATPSKSPGTSQPNLPNGEVLSTPTSSRLSLLVALSPLTPLPETPLIHRETRDRVQSRLIQLKHTENIEDVNDVAGTSQVTLTNSGRSRPENHSSPPPLPQFITHAQHSIPMGPPVYLGVERRSLTVPGRKPINTSSDAFSVMMRARQEKTRFPVHSAVNKRADTRPMESTPSSSASTSLTKDASKTGGRHEGLGSLSNKLKPRMRPREKPKVETVLNLSVPVETDPETDSQTILDQTEISHDQEPASSVDRPSSAPKPPLVKDKSRETGVESDIINTAQHKDKLASLTPATIENPLPVLPEKNTHHPATGGSSSDASLGAASTGVIRMIPSESGPKVTAKEQGSSTIERTEIICDQPAENALPHAGQAVDAVVVPPSNLRDGDKARLGRKKASRKVVAVGRMTRSTTSRLKTKEPTVARSALRPNISVTPRATRSRSTSTTSAYGKSETAVQGKRAQSKVSPADDISLLPRPAGPSSPVRTSSASNYAKPTTSSAAKVSKSPIRTSRTSPTKLNRTSSLPGSRPPSALSRVPTSSADPGAPSSLSTLSTALEKLRMPPPSRPNTSMGFYAASDETDDSTSLMQHTSDTERAGLGNGFSTSTKLRRRSSSFTLPTSTFGTSTAKHQSTEQQPISLFLTPKQGSSSTNLKGLPKPGSKAPLRPKIFGVGSRGVFGVGMRNRAPKVSRKTSLPMVVGSPVKGGEPVEIQDNNEGDGINKDGNNADNSLEIVMDRNPDATNLGEDEYLVPIAGYSPKETGKKEKDESEHWKTSSRRASLASLALSESLSALPLKGPMGPPSAIPRHGRVTRSTSGSYALASQLTSPADEKVGGVVDTDSRASSSISSSLRFLKRCVVFVDVRTDEGDDAGSLFVEMLEGAGAKVLTRVGQTCTHIIFKNGLLSTMGRYRLLRDPKPHVVGIAWVVECIEQRKHVDEDKFLVDLSDINTSGASKRRKSHLPKLVALDDVNVQAPEHRPDEDSDRSMDGSNSSLTLDDLPPLERARRRKSFLMGPRC